MMTITVGDKLPDAQLLKLGEAGPEAVSLHGLIAGKKAVVFAVPGAFTGVCSTSHVPSFIQHMDDLKDLGVDAVICVSVNDPFVMEAWSKDTGAAEAGIHMLADADGAFIRATGLDFTAPPIGLIGRAQRFAAMVDDSIIRVLEVEDNPGLCGVSGGASMVEAIKAL